MVALSDPQFKDLMVLISALGFMALMGFIMWCCTKVKDDDDEK